MGVPARRARVGESTEKARGQRCGYRDLPELAVFFWGGKCSHRTLNTSGRWSVQGGIPTLERGNDCEFGEQGMSGHRPSVAFTCVLCGAVVAEGKNREAQISQVEGILRMAQFPLFLATNKSK